MDGWMDTEGTGQYDVIPSFTILVFENEPLEAWVQMTSSDDSKVAASQGEPDLVTFEPSELGTLE